MDLLVTYDISTADRRGERRLAKVAAICERYGLRAQYSVFECRTNELGLARLVIELADAIEPAVDSVHLYRIGGTIDGARTVLGRPRSRQLGDRWIL